MRLALKTANLCKQHLLLYAGAFLVGATFCIIMSCLSGNLGELSWMTTEDNDCLEDYSTEDIDCLEDYSTEDNDCLDDYSTANKAWQQFMIISMKMQSG